MNSVSATPPADRRPDRTVADDGPEIQLPGGMGSGGLVVRVGGTVRRPATLYSPAVNGYLDHLAAVGFDASPRVLGVDAQGRDVLSWIDGEVGIPPFPDWVADAELLSSVADLQRRLHVASVGFQAPSDAVWQAANLPPVGGNALVCHNDLCVENVVVVDGRAIGFIDFDFAAPSHRLIDIAIAARHWVPTKVPTDVTDARSGLDLPARFRAFCDAHSLDADERVAVIDHLGDFLDRAMVTMKARADAGLPLYVAEWERGYPLQNRRSRAWLEDNAEELRRPG